MSIKLQPGGFKARVASISTAVVLTGTAILVPAAALADHTTAHLIEQLQAQIAALQTQLNALAAPGAPAPVAGVAVGCSFTRPLSPGMSGSDVKCLQQYLNGAGHQVAASGAGSPGNETMYYGSLTQAAVKKWQDASGVSYGAYGGYFGPVSQAKYKTVAVAAPAAPAAPGAPAAPVAVGSGLTVSSPASQPAATLAPQSSARVAFVKMILTASADGDVTVKNITVERTGLADNAAFDGVLLLDEDGTQIGNAKTLSSDNKVTLVDGLTVKAGTSKTVTIAANMASSLTNQAGQTAKLKVAAIDAGSSAVHGALPIESEAMTINSTLTIGSVTMSIGALDPGAANTKNVGTTGYYLASVKASVGSAEDVTFEQIRFNQAGSATKSDLAKIMVVASNDNKEYPAEISSDGKYYITKFPGGLKIAKGKNIDFSVKADIADGSDRTIDMNILKKADMVVKGDTFGYHIIVGGGSSGSADPGAFSSNQEPFFNAYLATISKGSLLVSGSNKVPAANIPIDQSDTLVGGFLFDVKGEPVQISKFDLTFTFTGTGTSTDVTQVKLIRDDTGGIVAGPKDPASGIVSWTDTWTAPKGETHLLVKAKLDTTFATDDTVKVSVDPNDKLTVKGEVTGLSITASPTSAVDSNTQTVKGGSLKMSVADTPAAQNVVRGVNGFHFGTFILDAGASGENVRITSVKLTDTVSKDAIETEVNSCILYDGATQLNTGSDVVNPTDDSGTDTAEEYSFTLTNNLIVPKGTVKKIDMKCNIASSATANSIHQWGLTVADSAGVTGSPSGQAITESVTTANGSRMTIKTAGSFTIAKDSSSPVEAIVIGGKTDVPMLVLRYHAEDEPVNIKELTLTYSSTTASTTEFLKATVWDGATKLGEAVWAGSAAQFATSTFTSDFKVPKDGDKVLTVKADIGPISVNASTTAGRLLSLDYDGTSSSSGIGVDSGQKLGSGSAGSLQGGVMQIMKSVPTFEKLAVPASTLPASNISLYRFKVTADAAGPIALYKFTFLTASSSLSATSSNFNLYAYTDSSFSVQAYERNPLNFQAADCAGTSNLQNVTTLCSVVAGDGPGAYATSTVGAAGSLDDEIVFFFTPVGNVASTTEAISISAGATRYFDLKGDITLGTGGQTGNTIQFGLAGDAARPERTGAGTFTTALGGGALGGFHDGGRGFLAPASVVAEDAGSENDFVWSALSTSTTISSATSSNDWTNGYLVPGLPSTNMTTNTFSN